MCVVRKMGFINKRDFNAKSHLDGKRIDNDDEEDVMLRLRKDVQGIWNAAVAPIP